MIPVKATVEAVARQLYDDTFVSWTENELLGWLRDGVAALAKHRPELFIRTAWETLVGGPKQTRPEGTIRVLRGIMSRITPASQPRAVTPFDIASMSAVHPRWAQDFPGEIRQVAIVADDEAYYVYPPAIAGAQLLLEQAKLPAMPASSAASGYNTAFIDLDARYAPALIDYVLHRAYSKNVDAGGQPERAGLHYQNFIQGVRGDDSAA